MRENGLYILRTASSKSSTSFSFDSLTWKLIRFVDFSPFFPLLLTIISICFNLLFSHRLDCPLKRLTVLPHTAFTSHFNIRPPSPCYSILYRMPYLFVTEYIFQQCGLHFLRNKEAGISFLVQFGANCYVYWYGKDFWNYWSPHGLHSRRMLFFILRH